MKIKNIISIVTLLFSISIFAQNSIETGNFDQLVITNKLHVELIASTKQEIEIITGTTDDISIENNGGTLQLKNNVKSFSKEGDFPLKIKLYYKQIKSIQADAGAYVFSNEEVIKLAMRITANLGSIIELEFDTIDLLVKTNSGAQVVLKGKLKNLTAEAATASSISAKNIENTNAKVSVTTGAVIDIRNTGTIDAQTKAGGTINIYGKPLNVKSKVNFGGNITENFDQ